MLRALSTEHGAQSTEHRASSRTSVSPPLFLSPPTSPPTPRLSLVPLSLSPSPATPAHYLACLQCALLSLGGYWGAVVTAQGSAVHTTHRHTETRIEEWSAGPWGAERVKVVAKVSVGDAENVLKLIVTWLYDCFYNNSIPPNRSL